MAFPTTPLPLLTELLIGNVWTLTNDMSTLFDRRIADGITITRGRRDWSSRVTASQCSHVFENADGKYSNRKPTSPYYKLLGRNTKIRHRILWFGDTFDGRTVASGWGNGWNLITGTAAEFAVAANVATQTHTAVDAQHLMVHETGVVDHDVTADLSWDFGSAVGAPARQWVVLRYVDSSNYMGAQLTLTTTATVTLQLFRVLGGSFALFGTPVTVGTGHTPNEVWRVRVRPKAGWFNAMAWRPGVDPEPAGWQLTPQPITDAVYFTATKAGLASRLEVGNTNTLSRVSTFNNFQANGFRFWGETPSFSPLWDESGRNVTVPVDAAGILQRLSTRAKPLRSPLFRTMAGVAPNDYVPHAYWPMEDGSGATSIASGLSGASMTTTGAINFASASDLDGSEPLPVFAAEATALARIPSYADSGQWTFQFALRLPSSVTGTYTFLTATTSLGGIIEFGINTSVSAFSLDYTPPGAAKFNVGLGFWANPADVFGRWVSVTVSSDKDASGTDDALQVGVYRPDGQIITAISELVGTTVHGTARSVKLGGSLNGVAYGHIGLYVDSKFQLALDDIVNAKAMNGWSGERAGDRMTRLAREEGVPFELVGNASDTSPMGVQRQDTLVNLLFACVDADQGRLYEPRDAFGLAYRTGASLDNQTPVALDYAANHIFGMFQPVEDDQLLVNDVTVKRTNGSSTRVEVTTGPLSTQDPPNGVGTYDIAPELNLSTDLQTGPLANWLASLGTWDEARFPTVTVEMAAPDVVADGLLATVPSLDIGDTLSVANPPSWLPPEAIGLLIEGTTEYVGNGMDWSLTFNTVPSGPFDIGVYGDANKPYDNDFTTTSGSLTTTATAVNYTCTSGRWATTASEPAEFPYFIVIGGERMRVTAATASTFTVTRSINGVVKSHATAAPVHVFRPARYGLGR